MFCVLCWYCVISNWRSVSYYELALNKWTDWIVLCGRSTILLWKYTLLWRHLKFISLVQKQCIWYLCQFILAFCSQMPFPFVNSRYDRIVKKRNQSKYKQIKMFWESSPTSIQVNNRLINILSQSFECWKQGGKNVIDVMN